MWGSPPVRVTGEYPLNLRGASCSTLAVMTPACNWQGKPYRTAQKLFNVPPWGLTFCPQADSSEDHYLHLTAGVEPTPRGWEKGHGDNVPEYVW